NTESYLDKNGVTYYRDTHFELSTCDSDTSLNNQAREHESVAEEEVAHLVQMLVDMELTFGPLVVGRPEGLGQKLHIFDGNHRAAVLFILGMEYCEAYVVEEVSQTTADELTRNLNNLVGRGNETKIRRAHMANQYKTSGIENPTVFLKQYEKKASPT